VKSEIKITVDDFEKEMKKALKFFTNWQTAAEEEADKLKVKGRDREKLFLAQATWLNLRVTICGFTGYARSVLQSGELQFVPFLHSNQSSLENVFSQIRYKNRDSTATVAKGVTSVSLHESQKNKLEGNKFYSKEHLVNESQATKTLFEQVTRHKDEKRREKCEAWVSRCRSSSTGAGAGTGAGFEVKCFRGGFSEQTKNALEAQLAYLLLAKPLNCHFNLFLMEREDFGAIAQISVGGPLCSWFDSLCSLTPDECAVFDQDIQVMNEFLFTTYCQTMFQEKKSTASIKFFKTIIAESTKRGAEKAMTLEKLQVQGAVSHLFLTLARWFWERLVQIQRESKPDEKVVVLGSPKKEVNRFLGWAIFSLLEKFKERQETEWAQGEDETEFDEIIGLLKEMRILHSQAILNTAYMQNCYEPLDVMANLGGLTLVSPKFFSFGLALIKVVSGALSQELMKRDGDQCMQNARNRVKESIEELRRMFLIRAKNHPLQQAKKLEVMDKLVEKVCNARFGAVLRLFKDHETGRRGDKKSDTTLRGSLKAL